ncbi:amidoligase family protein [Paenibacillus sp. 3LSP]|uniref:amidoligase family protein n=1 Tax=Paenibacillus sp. 3LSP TaxID=2800795 RepID=UPI002905A6AD|nr:amidoligase family protein [Paenibacillus sp. 3LSP]
MSGDSAKLYKVELVSPVFQYSDIETVQQIVRLLRKAGAKAINSCGIHVHIDASCHMPRTLRNLINIMASKEDLLYKALNVNAERQMSYARKVSRPSLKR